MVRWHAACSLQRARRQCEFVCYLRQTERHEERRRRFSGLRIRGQILIPGQLLPRLEKAPWLNAPWAVAPANFGFLSSHLLIGNVGSGLRSGLIAVQDLDRGACDGLLRDANDMRSKTTACGRCALATTMLRAPVIGCTSPPVQATRRMACSAS